jgi:hypothetical protein
MTVCSTICGAQVTGCGAQVTGAQAEPHGAQDGIGAQVAGYGAQQFLFREPASADVTVRLSIATRHQTTFIPPALY